MEILAIHTARTLAFFPTDELNPYGMAIIPNLMRQFVERYSFQKYPQTIAEFDEPKGVLFEVGTWNELAFSMTYYPNGVLVDTRSSTSDSEKILEDVLIWTASVFNLPYRPDILSRKMYLSELTFRSETPLDALNPKLKVLSERLSGLVSNQLKQSLNYETIAIVFHFDPTTTKYTPASVRVERLNDAAFWENKYYSTAPLSTADHIAFLEEFEAALKG